MLAVTFDSLLSDPEIVFVERILVSGGGEGGW